MENVYLKNSFLGIDFDSCFIGHKKSECVWLVSIMLCVFLSTGRFI